MIQRKRSLDINARPEQVWAILSRFMHIDDFAPQITSVDALTTGADGVGSKRRCHFANGTSLVEEVTDWQVNRGYTVRLSQMALPLHEATAAITLAHSNTGTRVTWSMDYHVKHGALGWLMGQTLMKMMVGGVLTQNLAALAAKVQADSPMQPA